MSDSVFPRDPLAMCRCYPVDDPPEMESTGRTSPLATGGPDKSAGEHDTGIPCGVASLRVA